MKTKVCRVPDISHEEWLALRRTGIGGSDASTIVGLNPYNSLYYLYNDKLGLLPAKEDSEAMRQGRDLEQYVAQRWMEATGKRCQRNCFMWRSCEHPCMLADIDREVVGENAGLECKTTSVYNKSDFERGEIPLTYYVQCQHYMAVMGYDRMYLAVLVLNRAFYHFTIERDEGEIAALIQAEQEFWENHIVPEVPPELDGSDATLTALSQRYPEENGITVHLSRQAVQMLQTAEELREQMRELEQAMDASRAFVMQELGEAACGISEHYSVSWKPQTRVTLDSKKLKKRYPEIYQECSRATTTRVFRMKKKEEVPTWSD